MNLLVLVLSVGTFSGTSGSLYNEKKFTYIDFSYICLFYNLLFVALVDS